MTWRERTMKVTVTSATKPTTRDVYMKIDPPAAGGLSGRRRQRLEELIAKSDDDDTVTISARDLRALLEESHWVDTFATAHAKDAIR